MAVFKRNAAITIDKMNVLTDIVIDPEKVKFKLNYSQIDLKPKEVRTLLSDILDLYVMVRPMLDKQKAVATAEQLKKLESNIADDTDDSPIDLGDIPF